MNEILKWQKQLDELRIAYLIDKNGLMTILKEEIEKSIYNRELNLDLIDNEYLSIALQFVESELENGYIDDSYRAYLKNLQVKILERVFKES